MENQVRTLLQKTTIFRLRWGAIFCACIASPAALFASSGNDDRLGLPAVSHPADNPSSMEKIALGKKLFFDARLSGDGSVSCAHCHKPEQAFCDGLVKSKGIHDRIGTRNAPSILNAAFNTSQFWDGRQPSLEAQATDPLLNPREHGLKDEDAVLKLLRSDAEYRKVFSDAFHVSASNIELKHVGKALASFQRTLVAGNSRFDRYYYQGDKSALSESAVRGLALFMGAAQCTSCHTIEKTHALFSDNQFHSLSVGMNRINKLLPAITTQLVRAKEQGDSLDRSVLSDENLAELGRFAVTLKPKDIGKFRTPSLRNVALTAPYIHDGSVATLSDAVEFELYYRSAERGYPLVLTPVEKADLVEFLESLTSAPGTLAIHEMSSSK